MLERSNLKELGVSVSGSMNSPLDIHLSAYASLSPRKREVVLSVIHYQPSKLLSTTVAIAAAQRKS